MPEQEVSPIMYLWIGIACIAFVGLISLIEWYNKKVKEPVDREHDFYDESEYYK